MYNGWTESQEAIEARKARILAGQYRRPGGRTAPATSASQPDGQQGNQDVTLTPLEN